MTAPILSICNSANFNRTANWRGIIGDVSTVGTNGKPSYYGTYDQTGNVDEIIDSMNGSGFNILRGGSSDSSTALQDTISKAAYRAQTGDGKTRTIGFRIARAYYFYFDDMGISPIAANEVVIGNPENAEDPSNNYGRVNYRFIIGKYTVTNSEYMQFLTAVAKTPVNSVSLWVADMGNASLGGGISRTLTAGSYVYSLLSGMGNKPVNFVNWWNAARYVNWLHNGKPNGVAGAGTTETGVYTILPILRVSGAKPAANNKYTFWIPSEDEWYKAAYYDPTKNGGAGGYWNYATQSDTLPDSIVANGTGDAINTARNPNSCISPTPTPSNSPTPSITPTITPTFTPTRTTTPTPTPTNTITATPTPSITTTNTITPTRTVTKTIPPTPSVTRSNTPTPTVSSTVTQTPTPTKSPTPTATTTSTVTPTPSKSLCSHKKLGELIYQNNVYADDDIKVVYKGYVFGGKLLEDVSTLYIDNTITLAITPTPTRTVTPSHRN